MKKTKNRDGSRSKRLELLPLSDTELAALAERETDEHMRAAYGEMLSGCREHPEERLFHTAWEMRLRESGERVGDFCFKGGPGEDGVVELGYGVDEAFRGQGYATEAARAAVEWAFSREGVYFVAAESERDNAPSLRVIEKLGMKPAGEGAEGPRFEVEKPATAWLSIYMCLGMSVGLCFGTASDNLAVGLSIGMCLGVAVGASMDAADKKKRAEIRARRGLAPEKEEK